MTLVYTSTENEGVVCQLPFRITLQIFMICFTIVTVFNTLLSCMKTPSLNIFIFLLLPSSKTPTVTKLSSTINRLSSWTICNLAPKIPDTNCNWFSDVFVTWFSLCYCNIFTAKKSRFIIAEMLLLRYCRYLI